MSDCLTPELDDMEIGLLDSTEFVVEGVQAGWVIEVNAGNDISDPHVTLSTGSPFSMVVPC
jgi:hypothetical protein